MNPMQSPMQPPYVPSVPVPPTYPGYPQVFPAPVPRPAPLPGFRFLPTECEHCFCREPEDDWTGKFSDHEECCGCGSRRLRAGRLEI